MAIKNVSEVPVFFDTQIASTQSDNLISAQVDPSQPQVMGLSTVTGPLVSDRHLSVRLRNFDPQQFNLTSISRLVRLLSTFIAGSGVGGLRRQQIIARMGNSLSGTHFIELDAFWGKIFSLSRAPNEALPTNAAGTPVDPSVDIADSVTWAQADARDGQYRSRIEQLARGVALGATYDGMRLSAQAVLNAEVEVIEAWTFSDFATDGSPNFHANTYYAEGQQYTTWGSMDGVSWGMLSMGSTAPVTVPLGNRGEIIIVPGRDITDNERLQLHTVLNQLSPAGTMVTISPTPFIRENDISCRGVHADSVDWSIASSVSQYQSADTGMTTDLYPASTASESARPAMGGYSGESWSYNSQVARVRAYSMDVNEVPQTQVDYQTVTYSDGITHDYLPRDALVDYKHLARSRAMSEGVLTTFPYAPGRLS